MTRGQRQNLQMAEAVSSQVWQAKVKLKKHQTTEPLSNVCLAIFKDGILSFILLSSVMCFSRETTGIALSSSQTHIKYFSIFSFISPFRYSSGEICSKWQHLWQPVLFVLPFVLQPVKSHEMKIAGECWYHSYICKKKVIVYFREGQTETLTATSSEGLCISEAAWNRLHPCRYVSKPCSRALNRIPHSSVNKICHNKLINLCMEMLQTEFSACAFSLCASKCCYDALRGRFWKCKQCFLPSKLLISWIETSPFHFKIFRLGMFSLIAPVLT